MNARVKTTKSGDWIYYSVLCDCGFMSDLKTYKAYMNDIKLAVKAKKAKERSDKKMKEWLSKPIEPEPEPYICGHDEYLMINGL